MNRKSTKELVHGPRVIKALTNQYRKALKDGSAFIKYYMSEEPWVWYLVYHSIPGDDDEYAQGEYVCRLIAPVDFPFKPPTFEFLTPNGVYGMGVRPCVGIGHYHSENYAGTLGMYGFAEQLMGGLIGWKLLASSGGIGILNTSVEEKRLLAKQSVAYNLARIPQYLIVCKNYDQYTAENNK